MPSLSGKIGLHVSATGAGVGPAVDDLRRDLLSVLGHGPQDVADDRADIRIAQDASLGREAWRLTAADEGVTIAGGDALGTIYGIYAFSERFLGVEPLWFWKDLPPEQQDAVEIPPQVIESPTRTFRYRGWFINDEDLLTEWQLGGGQRDIRYPFYRTVVHPDVIDHACEALLRTGGNLIIPASFLDVMNEPEAELVRRCVRRGLYVTQHHIEPLGVSHFGFENYWRDRGQQRTFQYVTSPDAVLECWRAYARRWSDLAGEQVIWQLGLRGKGDVPVWRSVDGVDRATGGRIISNALAEQAEIVRQVDSRTTPPMTTTLWDEGSELMAEGSLTIPDEVTIIFANDGLTQTMQADFEQTPRQPERRYGLYTHVAFWSRGPHLVQGIRPADVQRKFRRVVDKGDTHYGIVNVCNIREHVLGIEATMACMNDVAAYDPDKHIAAFAGQELQPLYRDFLGAFVDVTPRNFLQDGGVQTVIRIFMRCATGTSGGTAAEELKRWLEISDAATIVARLTQAAEQFESVAARFDELELPERQVRFYEANLKVQAQIMAGLCRCAAAMPRMATDPDALDAAADAIATLLEQRQAAEYGKWEYWYRGDRKVNVAGILQWLEEFKEGLRNEN